MIYTITLNPAVDKVIEFEGLLEREKNNKIRKILYDIGGKGCHVSTILSVLGIENTATGFAGGNNGDKLIKLLKEKNVKCEFINTETETRECSILVDGSSAGSFMVTEPGKLVSDDELEKLMEKIRSEIKEDDIVAFSGSPMPGFSTEKYVEIIKEIEKTKAKLFIDARDEYLEEAVKFSPFFIKPNKHEFQHLTGKKLESTEDYVREIKKYMENINIVVVSLGSEGPLVGIKGEGIYSFKPPKVEVVSETGCGDAFVGGVLAQYYLGKSPVEIFKFATSISASKATHFLSSDFSIEQTEGFIDKVQVCKYE